MGRDIEKLYPIGRALGIPAGEITQERSTTLKIVVFRVQKGIPLTRFRVATLRASCRRVPDR